MALLFAFNLSLMAQDKEPFWLGADISGTTELEAQGVQLRNSKGEIRESTALMKELGLNAIRLRVWVNPHDGFCNAQDVLDMAKRARYYGMAIMIDFHYSDWWADPGKQNIPMAWQYGSMWDMKQYVRNHTADVLSLLKKNNIEVKWVQVGNETTHGFLWPMGKAEASMQNYAELTQAGYEAVKSVYPHAKVIIHLDGGCDAARYDFIFDGLKQYGAKWDIIGMSVYPYWDIDAQLTKNYKETIKGFTNSIKRLYKKFGTPSMVVETGVEAKKPVEGKKIMTEIIKASKENCENHCEGVFYWAPEAEGAYPLGAFDNHQPTAIMDAFTEAATR